MKLAGLVAAVSASPAQWITQNWWNEAVNVYNYASANPESFSAAVNSVGDAAYQPLFSFCGGVDGVVDSDELTTCAAQIAGFVEMSETSQNYLYSFGAKYWNILDWDQSGSLNFDEFKIGIGAFAATNARVVIDAYDNNADGILSGSELSTWKSQVLSTGNKWGWSVSDSQWGALQAAYADAQVKLPGLKSS
jgi:hypothetical protein